MKHVSRKQIRKRTILSFWLFLIIIIVIVARLAYVQFVIGNEVTEKAEDSWLRDIEFQADRGNLLDTNGEVLTKNISAPSVILVPEQIKDKKTTAKDLARVLDLTEKEAYDYVTKSASNVRIHPKGRKISEDQEKKLSELNIEGVYLAKDSKRFYPHDNYLAHVLGFTGIDNQGLMGLELEYNDHLQGEKGALHYYSDAKGGKIPDSSYTYRPPDDGLHLKTSIDLDVQTIIERELDLAEVKYNPEGAMAIAVNPKTGGVVAMASRPDFNPADYKTVNSKIFDRNLPIWSTFEPGSTFKIITLAASLEEQLIDLEKDTYDDTGSIEVSGSKLRCWKAGGHGEQTMLEVVQNSCNPGFVHIGQKLGEEKLFNYIRNFGFGRKTGIDLEGEGTGILFKPDQVGPIELATTSFGQGVSVTPIQQVMAVSAAVNGGHLYEPHVAQEWLDPVTEETVETIDPKEKKQVISESTSNEVTKALESVVAKGTGRTAYVDGYRVGGKTGTAQKVGSDGRYLKNNHIVSFLGFAPADDPELVVLVAVDNPQNTVQFGGVVAGPIVGNIMKESLPALGVKRRDDGIEKEYQWPEEPKEEVPDMIGLEKEDLLEDLSTFKIETRGEGEYIIDQVPQPGVKVKSDATIKVYLSKEKE